MQIFNIKPELIKKSKVCACCKHLFSIFTDNREGYNRWRITRYNKITEVSND